MFFMKNNKSKPVFSQNLIKLRKERGMSQSDLAKLCGVTQRMITYYENQAVRPPIDKIEAIAKALNVKIDDLLGMNKETNIQKEFINIDARTLKKLKLIISLPKNQRHIIYSMAESFLKQNQENKNN